MSIALLQHPEKPCYFNQVLLLWGTRTGAYGVGLGVTYEDSDNHGGQQYAPLMDIDIPGL